MTKTIIIFLLFSSIFLSACNPGRSLISPTPSLSNGIEGTVTEGPMCPGPVPIGNNICPDQPYMATISILDTNKTQISQIQTDSKGHFKIQLIPGTYILHPEPGKPFPNAPDQTVEVISGQYTQVTIVYDTGIR
jgi:hypothetical protein